MIECTEISTGRAFLAGTALLGNEGKALAERPPSSWAQMRKAMRYSIWDGMAANMSENMFGPFLALFALGLGASKAQIGLLSSLPGLLGNLVQIPAAVLTERLGRRKLICILAGTGSRLCILAAFFVPFMENKGVPLVALFIGAVTLRGLVGSLNVPAWTAIMADITPKESRGSFFGTRNILSSLTGLVGTLAAGWIIRVYGFPGGYQWSFFAAFILGALSLVFFGQIPVEERRSRQPREGAPKGADNRPSQQSLRSHLDSVRGKWQRSIEAFSSQRNFRKYCLTSIFWGFSVSLGGPLISVFFAESLGGSAALWSVCSSAGLIATMVGQRYWGRLSDHFGPKSVMVLGGIGAASLPLVWLAIPVPELGFIASFIGSFGWGGYNLAAFNFLLELTPDENRPTYVGVYNTLVGVTTSVAPLVGGLLAEAVGLRWVMLISGVLRFTSYFVFVRNVDDTRSTPMRPSDLLPLTMKSRRNLPG